MSETKRGWPKSAQTTITIGSTLTEQTLGTKKKRKPNNKWDPQT